MVAGSLLLKFCNWFFNSSSLFGELTNILLSSTRSEKKLIVDSKSPFGDYTTFEKQASYTLGCFKNLSLLFLIFSCIYLSWSIALLASFSLDFTYYWAYFSHLFFKTMLEWLIGMMLSFIFYLSSLSFYYRDSTECAFYKTIEGSSSTRFWDWGLIMVANYL